NGHDKAGLAFSHATQDDDPRSDRRSDPVRERAELLHVAVTHVRGDQLRRADHLGLAQKTGGRALDAAALVGLELVLELLARLGQLYDRLGHALWRDAERR